MDTPVTQLEFTRESSTLDKVNRFKSTGKLGTAGLCSNVFIIGLQIGNHDSIYGRNPG